MTRLPARARCNSVEPQYCSALSMKNTLLVFFVIIVSGLASSTRGGSETTAPQRASEPLDAPSFEMAAETSYLVGIFGNPNSYEIGAQFITARWRIGEVKSDSWLRGYHQFYALAMAEPVFRGPENHYFGISTGFRYNFVQPGGRLIPYISGGVGLGWIDSTDTFGGQGQDFTFNILSAVGVSYKMNDHWKASGGFLYQHLSNGGQTDPNPSLNLFGPQVGLTYSF
jgi:lipid A 3-O-deacylase